MKLSVVIITYNVEGIIERCLKSVMGVADEILVVDSFSTDETVSLCEEYNARVIRRAFSGYGNQKQFAANQAMYDFVLSLDADEELTSELIESIRSIKISSRMDYYSINRKNIYCNKWIRFCGWNPDKHIRLFDRQKIAWNDKRVHESIEISNYPKAILLEGNMNHYTCRTVAEHQQKEKKYSIINAEILVQKGEKISVFTPYLSGLFRFFNVYILKLGLFDGYYGFLISTTLAKSSFNKYRLARDIINSMNYS
jgi:glycosyltransferase involved in cell wall biosynthesis